MNRRSSVLIGVVIVTALVAMFAVVSDRTPPAGAFGSVNLPGTNQRPVHEPITRTLGCVADDAVSNCFEPLSLDILAGRSGTWGAVGEPDDPFDGVPNPAARHCDDVDQGYGSYRTLAEAQIDFDKCLQWYQAYMEFAVASAARLLLPDGTIDPSQIGVVNAIGTTSNVCTFPDPQKGNTSNDSAKCNVLGGLGRALHGYEDIWSHSNWGDVADPTQAVGLRNPAGLANTTQPTFMAFPGPTTAPIPAGFLSGCDDSIALLNSCSRRSVTDPSVTERRTGHSDINKDNGTVDPLTCIATDPLTTRGRVVVDGTSNFQRAVTGACGAARRAWSDLQSALIARYGASGAAMMIRAIVTDHPLTACTVGGVAASAFSPPTGDRPSARSVTILVVNATPRPMVCGDAVLDGGEWASYPPDSIAPGATVRWRTQSAGFATGTSGRSTFRSEAGDYSVVWDDPYLGSNSSSCSAPSGSACTRTGGSGTDATITVTFSGP